MTTVRRLQTGSPSPGLPAFRRAIQRHPVILIALALVAFCQTGCQSCGPSGCGYFPRIGNAFRNASERVFRPFQTTGTCCGSELGGPAAPLMYGTPAVVTPAPAVSAPSSLSPIDSSPLDLKAIDESKPSAVPGPPPSNDSTGAKSTTGKTSYEAYRPRSRDGQVRSDALARTLTSSPASTARSAQGPTGSKAEEFSLDNLPPLDVPRDLTNLNTRERDSRPEPATNTDTLLDVASRLTAKTQPGVTVAPGIRRFAPVDTKLAGGSLPDANGLNWLIEKGYKTILDLREKADISPAFISDVDNHGLRYIALPISLNTIDSDHVSRFNDEISQTGARPLYFCDTDGTRAAVLWYIRRITVDHVDPQVASRDAEEFGVTDNRFWAAAQAYLDKLKPPAAQKPATPEHAPSTPAPAPVQTPPLAPESLKPTPPPAPTQPGTNAPAPPTAGPAPSSTTGNETPALPSDPTAWRPLAALIVTGLGMPLAYLSRSAVPVTYRALAARASLPAAPRSPKSLPPASGG